MESNHLLFAIEYTNKKKVSTYLNNMLQFINNLIYHRIHSFDFDFRISSLGFDSISNHMLGIANKVKSEKYMT